MKKLFLVLICLFLVVGCGDSLYKDTEEVVLENSHQETKETIIKLTNELTMFPTEKDENTLVTYILVIRDHKDLFTSDELNDIRIILQNVEYQYKLNSLGYSKEEINKMIKEL